MWKALVTPERKGINISVTDTFIGSNGSPVNYINTDVKNQVGMEKILSLLAVHLPHGTLVGQSVATIAMATIYRHYSYIYSVDKILLL